MNKYIWVLALTAERVWINMRVLRQLLFPPRQSRGICSKLHYIICISSIYKTIEVTTKGCWCHVQKKIKERNVLEKISLLCPPSIRQNLRKTPGGCFQAGENLLPFGITWRRKKNKISTV